MVRETNVDNNNSEWWQIISYAEGVDSSIGIERSTSNVLDDAITLQELDEFDGGCVESMFKMNVDVSSQ